MSTECTCGGQGYSGADAESEAILTADVNVSCTLTNCGTFCPICHPRYCPCCGRRINPYWPQPYNPWPWVYPWMYPTYPPYHREDTYPQPYITWCESVTGDFPNMTVSVNIPSSDINGSASSDLHA